MEKIILTPDGQRMKLDGGKNLEDLNPKELLLFATGDCAGRTALQLLPKMRIEHTGFRIEVSGVISEDNGHISHMAEDFYLDGVPDEQIKKAVSMLHKTFMKYCTVGTMMKTFSQVKAKYFVNGKLYEAEEI